MNKTNHYLDAVKAKTGAASDYALAKLIGVSRQQMSKYRTRGEYLGGDAALKVAQILEIDPLLVLTSIQSEKAKSDDEKAIWKGLFEKLGGMAAALTLGIMLNVPNPAQASIGEVSQSANNASDLYIIRNRRNKKRRINPIELMVNQLLSLA